MTDETNIYNWLVTTIIGTGGLVISWLMNRAIGRLDKDLDDHSTKLNAHDKLHTECALDLAAFKTEVAKDYAKEQTMQQSLARIHDRLDEGFEELRADIKTLMSKK